MVHTSPSEHVVPSALVKTHPLPAVQLSVVQALPSLQTTALPDLHTPPAQPSPLVQALLSVHVAALAMWTQPCPVTQLSSVHGLVSTQPALLGEWMHAPLPPSHESAVQGKPSSQFLALPAQVPPPQTSLTVHGFPSLHALLLAVLVQFPFAQPSFVHKLPSLQSLALPLQLPPLQVSPTVQPLPSLQPLPLLMTDLQPLATSHKSLVHGLPSSHTTELAPPHVLLTQCSPVVQALPSSQILALALCLQLPSVQLSSVQTLLSLQSGALPLTQVPPLQLSPSVQPSPSLQPMPSAFLVVQPSLLSQESVVQPFPSSHTTLPDPVQLPPLHWSRVVHRLPSLHVPLPGKWTHLPPPQLSSVQTLLSLQSGALPLTQVPPMQLSPSVQPSPSLQPMASAFLVVQPSLLSQESVVQPFPSSHTTLPDPVQLPPLHWSWVVHRLPSLHVLLPGKWTHLPPPQLSSVHTLLSLQSGALPLTQVPPLQLSPSVQPSPSLQPMPSLKVLVQPLAIAQLSLVQPLPSSHTIELAPEQLPPVQCSPSVHALLSVQVAALGLWTHLPPPQLSSVHGLMSSQSGAKPGTQPPPAHTSPSVHASPSVQPMPSALVAPQPKPTSHKSWVHGLPSSHRTELPPMQPPFTHASSAVHAFPSLQVASVAKCTQPLPGTQLSVVQTEPSSQVVEVQSTG